MIFPVGCEPNAIPSYAPNPVKAHWLLIAMQETLSYSTFREGILPATMIAALFVLAPLLTGREGSHPINWRRQVFCLSTVALIGTYCFFTMVGLLYRGPNWTLLKTPKVWKWVLNVFSGFR